jgi:2-hydroxychromene-2-carboxylate isomerase
VTTSVPESAGTVDYWFDPICPFTWRTSRWLVDVATRRGLVVTWRVMSLGVLNNGAVAADEGPFAEAAVALRALVAAEDTGGQEALARLYTLLGTRKHDAGEPLTAEAVGDAARDAGLSPAVADAAQDTSLDERIARSHAEGQERAGIETGSPILALGTGKGYFGPVLTAIPAGDDADRLFDAVQMLASVPVFSEIKTSRS